MSTKALVPIDSVDYGKQTMIEKVTAYKMSDGELVGSKEAAIKGQKYLDREIKIKKLMQEYLKPFKAIRKQDSDFFSEIVTEIEQDVVTVWQVEWFLKAVFDKLDVKI